MSVLTPHVYEGRSRGAGHVIDEIYDAACDQEELEEEEIHAATDAHVSTDAFIEINVPEHELADIELDLPVMGILIEGYYCPHQFHLSQTPCFTYIPNIQAQTDAWVLQCPRRNKVEAAVSLLKHMLLTPSSPESSMINSNQLHGMSCPAAPGGELQGNLAPTAAMALLLNQTFRHTRLDEVCPCKGCSILEAGRACRGLMGDPSCVPSSFARFAVTLHQRAQVGGEMGASVRKVALAIEPFCIAQGCLAPRIILVRQCSCLVQSCTRLSVRTPTNRVWICFFNRY